MQVVLGTELAKAIVFETSLGTLFIARVDLAAVQLQDRLLPHLVLLIQGRVLSHPTIQAHASLIFVIYVEIIIARTGAGPRRAVWQGERQDEGQDLRQADGVHEAAERPAGESDMRALIL